MPRSTTSPPSKLQIFGRYSFSPTLVFDPPSLGAAGGDATNGGQPGTAPGRIQSTGIGGTYTVSPNVVVDGVFGYTRLRLSAKNVDIDKNYGLDVLKIPGTNGTDPLQGGYPRFTFNTFSSLGNPNVSNPFLFRDNQYVTNWNVSWSKGAHSFRFGFEYSKYDINHFQPQASNGPRGGFNFTGGLTSLNGGPSSTGYNSWGDFLLGLPQGMGKDVQYENPATVRMPSYGLYARDAWQVSRKLTIDYGIRFEKYPAPTRDHFAGERYDPNTDKVFRGGYDTGIGQLAPRLGIAYRLNEKTVIRTGAGISVDPNTFRYLRDDYPATISTQYSGANAYQAAGTLRTGIPSVVGPDLNQTSFTLPAAVGTTTFPQVFNRGYIESYNFTVQRDAGAGINVQAAYVGSRAIRSTAIENINAAGPGGGNAGRVPLPVVRPHLRHQVLHAVQHGELQQFPDAGHAAVRGLAARRLLHVVARHRLCGRYRRRTHLELGPDAAAEQGGGRFRPHPQSAVLRQLRSALRARPEIRQQRTAFEDRSAVGRPTGSSAA